MVPRWRRSLAMGLVSFGVLDLVLRDLILGSICLAAGVAFYAVLSRHAWRRGGGYSATGKR
jgi:hypothetical protein